MKPMVAVLLGLLVLGQGTPGWAQWGADESTAEQIGYGTGSVVGSAIYFPVKASFCILGAIGSGFIYVFANPDTANTVASASCRGTWAITPDALKGREPIQFMGEPPAK